MNFSLSAFQEKPHITRRKGKWQCWSGLKINNRWQLPVLMMREGETAAKAYSNWRKAASGEELYEYRAKVLKELKHG